MYSSLVFVSCLLAVASAGLIGSPLVGAPLLPKVEVGPAEVNVVKQPITIEQPELRYREVPVPVRAVSYAAPAVSYAAVPAVSYAAAPAVSYAAAPAVSYAAAPAISYAASPAISYGLGLGAVPAVSYTSGVVKVL